ncbi:MAG: S9 family peptidase [Actinomycetota bacterium]|nr:S9 family peptidase [Actinomycetota bacterium]
MHPTDLYRIRTVAAVAAVAGGSGAVYALSWADRESDANRSVLRAIDLDGDDRLLTTHHRATDPVPSPDGRWLAYVAADRPKDRPQLWLLPLGGGAPWPVSDIADGVVGRPSWAPDGSAVVVGAVVRPEDQEGVDDEELARRPRRITSTGYRFNGRGWIHDRRIHVHRFDTALPPASGEAPAPGGGVRLTDGPWDDTEAVVDADAACVLFVSARHDRRELEGGSDVWRVPLAGGDAERLTDGAGSWRAPRPAADGRVVVIGSPGRDVSLHLPHVLDPATGATRLLGDGEVGAMSLLSGGVPTVVGDELYASGVRRGRVGVDVYALDSGARAEHIGGDLVVGAFDRVAPDGPTWFAASTPTTPAELHVLTTTGDGPGEAGGARRVTGWNDELCAEVAFSPVEEVEVPSTEGRSVHAFVVRPPEVVPAADAGTRPGLVYVHGGPLAQYGVGLFDEFQIAAACGYVVIAANPAGSDGYGSAHATAIVGALGGRDWDDVTAVTDHLASLDDVDADRIGIGGGSYGGFMTSWAISHTDRYRAALVERAVTNWETFQGTSDIGPWFGRHYTGATTLDDVATLRAQSPMAHAGSITTPTLIVHSDEDWRCPPEQAEQLFVALRMLGVETELVRFPGQNHELTCSGRPSHRVERFAIVHEWWARHLGGAETGPEPDGPDATDRVTPQIG